MDERLTGDSCGGSHGLVIRVPYTLHLAGLMVPAPPGVKSRLLHGRNG